MFRNLCTGLSILAAMTCVATLLTDRVSLPTEVRLILAGLIFIALLLFIIIPIEKLFIIIPIEKKNKKSPFARGSLGRRTFPEISEIEKEYDAIKQCYGPDTLEMFAKMLGNLPRYLTRINEHNEILEETPQLQVTRQQTYQVDKEAPGICLVPLALIEKDTLLDNFVLKDANNKDVPTLPHNRLHGLLAITLEILITTAIRDSEKRLDQERTREIARHLVSAVSGPGPSSLKKTDPEESARIRELLDGPLKDLPLTPDWRRKLHNFCEIYVDYHLVVAEVVRADTDGNFLGLNYSHRVPLENSLGWRARFGLRPQVLDIPLHPYAFLVESYHQQITAEPGEYVFDHHLEWLKSQKPVESNDFRIGSLRPYVRIYNDEGRPNAHLYIRRQLAGESPTAGSAT